RDRRRRCRAGGGGAGPPSTAPRRGCNLRRQPGARLMTTRTSPRSRSGSRRHCAAPRRAATTPARLRGTRRRQTTLGWTRCCAARLERTSPARHWKRPRRPASPRRRRENLTRRAVTTTRPGGGRQRRGKNRTRRAVATTRPRASPQRRRQNRTRAVAMTAPNPNRVPPAMLQPTGAGELRQSGEKNGRQLGGSPRGAVGRTQRVKPRLLFIAQRIVEFRERRLHGLHCARRGVEPLLHRLDTTRGGQHLVGRATDLEAFRRLDGGILQVVERGPLRRRGLDRLADAVDRQVSGAGRLLVAKL